MLSRKLHICSVNWRLFEIKDYFSASSVIPSFPLSTTRKRSQYGKTRQASVMIIVWLSTRLDDFHGASCSISNFHQILSKISFYRWTISYFKRLNGFFNREIWLGSGRAINWSQDPVNALSFTPWKPEGWMRKGVNGYKGNSGNKTGRICFDLGYNEGGGTK